MSSNRLYYKVKPYLPWSLRMALRRLLARRKRRTYQDVWPINEAAGNPRVGWIGWPGGKKFALVLTHDVEGPAGLAKCRRLMQLEMKLGFRSSFNFIPEGGYEVPRELRAELTQNGFEVGVHDLRHDGKLYYSRSYFSKSAARINNYLSEWSAAGFRSGFMLRQLDWLHQLNIQYDASTFDTDPFEPQPGGVGTIFPFWVPVVIKGKPVSASDYRLSPSGFRSRISSPSSRSEMTSRHQPPQSSTPNRGFVELPYTLPQDSTLFLLLREPTPEIWLRKLDWIAQHGGMALVNVHPDYLRFPDESASSRTYPVALYVELLEHIKHKHAGTFWHSLPGQIAAFCKEKM
jgi:hypothetical protein